MRFGAIDTTTAIVFAIAAIKAMRIHKVASEMQYFDY